MAEEKVPLEPRDCAGLATVAGVVFVGLALLTSNIVLGILGLVMLISGFLMFWIVANHG